MSNTVQYLCGVVPKDKSEAVENSDQHLTVTDKFLVSG